MDHIEIQKRVNALSKAMLAKGLRQPSAAFRIECNKQCEIYLRWKDVTKVEDIYSNDEFKFIGGDTPEDAFTKASAYVDELPTADEARMRQFMGALANVIDLGKKNGVEVEFLNPLQATMKKLSENILTDQRAA
ncbi:hypothetical protein [Ensifer canadensis]|uniref:hypothetical protein n=1 Tax=Ensifer canadensis TaxID=555315 RepID=UPI0035E3D417